MVLGGMLGKGDYVLVLVGEHTGRKALIEGMSSYGKYPCSVEDMPPCGVTPCTCGIHFFGPDEVEPWRPSRWEHLMSEEPSPLDFRALTATEIRARAAEFEPLTNEPGSDLGMLLTAVSRGEDPILGAAVYEEGGKPLGWAVCERFSTRRQTAILLNVFVAPEKRRHGIGSELVRRVLDGLAPGIKPAVMDRGSTFWLRFIPRVEV